MSPTVFRSGSYRYFFFSREESRMHIHVESDKGEAKFWIEPVIALATFTNLSAKELKKIQTEIEEHRHEITANWKAHFKR